MSSHGTTIRGSSSQFMAISMSGRDFTNDLTIAENISIRQFAFVNFQTFPSRICRPDIPFVSSSCRWAARDLMTAGSMAQNGRRSSMIWLKSSMLWTPRFRLNLYHYPNPGGGFLSCSCLYFAITSLDVIDLASSYLVHASSACRMRVIIGWWSSTGAWSSNLPWSWGQGPVLGRYYEY